MATKLSLPRPKTPANDSPAGRSPVRRRIITEAQRHFFAHGFRSVTMDDLARELAMSKKTLYACFPSKSGLLESVIHEKFHRVDADLSRITSKASSDCRGALHRLLACVQGHMEEIRPPFVRDIRREAPDMFQLVQTRRRELIQTYFGKLFHEGRRAGIIRNDIPSRLMIEILLGATEAIMNPATMAEYRLTPKSGFVTIITVVLEGILSARGRSR